MDPVRAHASFALPLAAALFVTSSFAGCVNDDARHCAVACDRQQDCVDERFDVDACVDRCVIATDYSREGAEAAARCAACAETGSCSIFAECADGCADVLYAP